MSESICKGYGIEVTLKHPEDFLKVAETLTRIGLPSKTEKTLYQTCNILHKQSRYFILHFKEMLGLDGNSTTFDLEDEARRNKIVELLAQWNLIDIVPGQKLDPVAEIYKLKIVPFKDKTQWKLAQKYTLKGRAVNVTN